MQNNSKCFYCRDQKKKRKKILLKISIFTPPSTICTSYKGGPHIRACTHSRFFCVFVGFFRKGRCPPASPPPSTTDYLTSFPYQHVAITVNCNTPKSYNHSDIIDTKNALLSIRSSNNKAFYK